MKSNYVSISSKKDMKQYRYDILKLRCHWSTSVLDRRYLVGVPVKNEK